MKRLILLVSLAGTIMLSGCGDSESVAVAVIGGADGPTAVTVGEQVDSAGEYEDFFREMYADDLLNKYTQLCNDEAVLYDAYYSEDINLDDVIAKAEKCISTVEAIIAIEPPATLVSYHQDIIDGAQYEIKFYSNILNACLMAKGEADFSEQEIEEMTAFMEEYINAQTPSLNDAFVAVMDAANGVVQ